MPSDIRPLEFFNGVSRILLKAEPAYAVPLAFRYEFQKEFKPHIFVKIGKAELIEDVNLLNAKELTKELEGKLRSVLDELRLDIMKRNLVGYTNINRNWFKGSKGEKKIDELSDRFNF